MAVARAESLQGRTHEAVKSNPTFFLRKGGPVAIIDSSLIMELREIHPTDIEVGLLTVDRAGNAQSRTRRVTQQRGIREGRYEINHLKSLGIFASFEVVVSDRKKPKFKFRHTKNPLGLLKREARPNGHTG